MATRLTSTTTRLGAAPDLPGMIPPAGATAWISTATSLIGFGRVARLGPLGGRRRFQTLSERLMELFGEAAVVDEVDVPGSGPVAFGSFTFDENDPDSVLVVPEIVYGVSEGISWKTQMALDPARDGLLGTEAPLRRPESRGNQDGVAQWSRAFHDAYEMVAQGNLEKIVLARRMTLELDAQPDAGALVRGLAAAYPGCFTFAFEDLVGASPELLVRRLADVVESMPIAGSAPRSSDVAEDELLGAGLIASAKNRAEHEITKQDVMSKLSGFCYQMEVEASPSLMLLHNLQHLSTKVQGRLKGAWNALELAGALHPTAAVCGKPEAEALQTIRSVEGFSRGRYAGPVGWMDHRGDGEWAIALRCAQLAGCSANLFAGAGILRDSTEESEFDETEIKFRAMLSALEGGRSG